MTGVVFVGGLGRSGSTLLEQVLAAFPGVCALGEVVHLWQRGLIDDERCGCGRPFSSCPFWQAVGERAFGGWDRVDPHHVLSLADEVDRLRRIPAVMLLQRRDRAQPTRLREYAAYYERVYEAAAAVSGADVVLDSSKHASLAFVLRSMTTAQLQVVHLVRDSRGVAYSWTKTVPRPEAGQGGGHEFMHRYPPWRAALLWDGHNAAFALLARLGTPVRRVRYEDLLADPVAAVTRLAGELGLDAADTVRVVSPTAVTLRPGHQVAGNPMRFQTGEVPLRMDDAWREKLPTADRRLVSLLTAPLLAGYGYLRDTRPDGSR